MVFDHGEIMWAAVLAFLLSLLAAVLLRRPAAIVGLVDEPAGRKLHHAPVPMTGGIGILLGVATGLFLLETTSWLDPVCVLCGLALMVVGCIDDILDLPASTRLVVQLALAGFVVVEGGVLVESLGNVFGTGEIYLGPLSVPFTVTCIVFMTNAVNMMDGVDGLAGGVTLVMFLALALAGASAGGPLGVVSICILFVAAVAGFLIFNMRFPWQKRALVFMGDGGSLVLGFYAALMGISLAGPADAVIPPVVVAWILVLPALDVLSLFYRRLRRGSSPLAPDRTHLHHFLQHCGYPDIQVSCILIGTELLFALIGLGGWAIGVPEPLLGWGLVGLFILSFLSIRNGRRIIRYMRERSSQTEPASELAE